MKNYPENIEDKLEIAKIREIIASFCITEFAKSKAYKTPFINDINKIKLYFQQIDEIIKFLQTEEKPTYYFEDATFIIKKLKTIGLNLDLSQIISIKNICESVYNITQYLKRNLEFFPVLCELTTSFVSDKEIVTAINQVIDERGQVRNNASAELSEIRSELIKAEDKARKSINKTLVEAKKKQITEDEHEVTIREGRLVIPVKSEFKKQIQGFIHDESSSGQTVYLEPTEILEINNITRELQFRERREIYKILSALTDKLRENVDDLQKGAYFLLIFDFLIAKGKFAIEFNASTPIIQQKPIVNLHQAYHPLLKKINKENKKTTVPLDVTLTAEKNKILVISGPNAGGKTVAMKTVGLLQYMFQCGFPITVGADTTMGIFEHIFVDIGDSQSLENDLSTYSSRLKAMKYFLNNTNEKTLILIDELGTGTDPQIGGALASIFVKELSEKHTFGIITTHYSNIKQLASQTPGIVNGYIIFDLETMSSLYTLEIGKPGSSYALEIAQKIGLPKKIIQNTKNILGGNIVDYEKLLHQLESEKRKYQKLNEKLESQEKEFDNIKIEYQSLKNNLEKQKNEILKQAKVEANLILSRSNKTIENTIRHIKESQAEKKVVEQSRIEIDKLKKIVEIKENKIQPTTQNFKVGDKVFLNEYNTNGEILKINDKEAMIGCGNLKYFVKLSDIQLNKSNQNEIKRITKKIGLFDVNDRKMQFNSQLNIRGMRVEEVLPLLDKFIDDALLVGNKQVTVLHGKGWGILKNFVREHLQKLPFIEKIEDAHVDHGGSGISIITLKG